MLKQNKEYIFYIQNKANILIKTDKKGYWELNEGMWFNTKQILKQYKNDVFKTYDFVYKDWEHIDKFIPATKLTKYLYGFL